MYACQSHACAGALLLLYMYSDHQVAMVAQRVAAHSNFAEHRRRCVGEDDDALHYLVAAVIDSANANLIKSSLVSHMGTR